MAAQSAVLLTGGAGFLGACLARQLIAAGQELHLLLRPETNLWRLAGLSGQFVRHDADLRDAVAVRRAVEASRPEVVYHLAAHGAYPGRHGHDDILASNVLGTANLLSACATRDYRALVHAGSSSEYGHKDHPLREDDRLDPRSDYGVAKAAATLLCQAEAFKGRPVTTVRVFSAYGPWEDSGRLVPYLMACCWRGETPRLTAGWQPRDFIHAEDVVALFCAAAEQPEAHGKILHAGTGRRQTVRDMTETVLRAAGSGRIRADYGALSARPDEPGSWVASIEQTTALTGWKPRHDLASGVAQTWAWFRERAAMKAA